MEWTISHEKNSRLAWLILIRKDEVKFFNGMDIKSFVSVMSYTTHRDWKRNGKMCGTSYYLKIEDGVRVVTGLDGSTGFIDGLGEAIGRRLSNSWDFVASALGVPVGNVKESFRSWRPEEAARIDKSEKDLGIQRAERKFGVTTTVAFGYPTVAELKNGFWDQPKPIPGSSGKIQKIDPTRGWVKNNITIVGVSGDVVSVVKTPNNYYAVTVTTY